jgi:hypothetical protein
MLGYNRYTYLWPPRPERAQGVALIHSYERQGWWAQAKMDGDCVVLAIAPECDGRELIARTRHGDAASNRWQPGKSIAAFAATLPGAGWYVLVGEVLHCRGVGVRDTLYLHDVLVDDGDYLVGVTHADRQTRLLTLTNAWEAAAHSDVWSHCQFAPGLWLTRNHWQGFRALYDNPPGRYVEGLVFKDPKTPLRLCARASANSAGLAKCRYATNNLSF